MPAKPRADTGRQLREALAPYVDVRKLRTLAAEHGDLQQALHGDTPDDLPAEVTLLLTALSTLLRPARRECIRGPQDVAAMLMVELSTREQEELSVVLLNIKNQVVDIVTVYRGMLSSAPVRVAEVFKEAIRRNAAAIILVHNHPSGDVTPSPEDVFVTRQIVQAGGLLEIDVLDHLIIGRGQWTSLRERGLGFESSSGRR